MERVESARQGQMPPLLYDLTTLQREANARYGLTAQATLDLAQALYEKHKVLTYPRTDSRHLPHDMRPKVQKVFQSLPEPYREWVPAPERAADPGKRVFDDAKITDHHAIVPTGRAPGSLTENERRIFDLVVRQLLAAFYPPMVSETVTVLTNVEGRRFRSVGKTVLDPGWQAVKPPLKPRAAEEEQTLPALSQGQPARAERADVLAKRTEPPKPYTENTLLAAMENAGRFVEDEELRRQLKDRGLGTPATRAAILERLIEVGYVQRAKKSLLPRRRASCSSPSCRSRSPRPRPRAGGRRALRTSRAARWTPRASWTASAATAPSSAPRRTARRPRPFRPPRAQRPRGSGPPQSPPRRRRRRPPAAPARPGRQKPTLEARSAGFGPRPLFSTWQMCDNRDEAACPHIRMRGRMKRMLYSQQDIQNARNQLLRRIGLMAALAILPNVAGIVVMYTIRIEWLSVLLGCLGGAMAIFTWGLFCYPVYAYLRYAREVVTGRNHEFRGTLTTIAEDSVREGVPCKTLYFHDEAADDEKLCYFDLSKYPREGFPTGAALRRLRARPVHCIHAV